MNKKAFDVQTMTQMALLIAVVIVMKVVGLGSVPVGPLNMSFLTIPIAVGAIILGPSAGAVLGLVFGLLSFKDGMSGSSYMTAVFFQISPIHTAILCIGMRVLMGLGCGLIYRVLSRLDRKGWWSTLVGALSAPLLNTFFFMGYICLAFYNTEYIQGLCTKLGAANPLMFVVLLVGVQGLIEAVACGVIGTAVCRAVRRVLGLRRVSAKA